MPIEIHPEPEIITPEVVGYEPKPSWWQQFKSRALFSLILGTIGLILCAVGVLLTLSIIGAAIGIPLVLLGIGAAVMAVILFLGGGNLKVISFRRFP
ncbi:MAG: hypothetical protein HY547_09670 [Elusimicrobia bacterium]|nr:hypothetical protein [Elusimicrobiota bacterium]